MKKILSFWVLFILTISTNAQLTPQLKLPIGHSHHISTFCVTPDNKYIFTGSEEESKIIIWELSSCKQLTSINSESKEVYKIIMNPSGNFFVVSYIEGPIIAYDFPSFEIKWKIESKKYKSDIEFLFKGNYILIDGLLMYAETGKVLKENKKVSYVIDDSTYVLSNKKGDDVIDLKNFEKIKTVKIIPFKENRNSIINSILNFNRKDSSCLFEVLGHIICYDNNESLRYDIDIEEGLYDLVSLTKIPQSSLILAFFLEHLPILFNVENGEIKIEKELQTLYKGKSSGKINCSPDGKYLMVGNDIYLLEKFEYFQTLSNSNDENYFLKSTELFSLGLFPKTYTFQKVYIDDMSSDSDTVDSAYYFVENIVDTNVRIPTIYQNKFDKGNLIFNVNNENIQSLNLSDYSTKILKSIGPEGEYESLLTFDSVEIQNEDYNHYFPRFPNGIVEKTDRSILFETKGKEKTYFNYFVEDGYDIRDVLKLKETNQYLIKLRERFIYPKPKNYKNLKDKIILLNILEKKITHEYQIDNALFDVVYDTSRNRIILNEYNKYLHIIDANTFYLKKKLDIDWVDKKVGWFNDFHVLDTAGCLIFYNPSGIETNVLIFNWQTQKIEIEFTVPYTAKTVSFSSDRKYCYLFTGSELIVWDVIKKKTLFHYLPLNIGNWLVYDEDYHYDGSPGARDMLYFVCGLEVIELSQMKDALYVPDLAEKIISGQAINYKKLSELDICGTLPLIDTVSKNDKGYHYKITPRKYPLERLEFQVNKKNVITILPNKLSKMGNDFYLDLTEQEVSKHFIAGQANQVKLIGVVKEGNIEITTRGVEITSDESSSKTTNPPNLYAVMVGINDYKDENLHLNFPSKDAISLGKSVEQAAKKLLEDDHVFVYNVNTDFKNKQVKVISTPEKEGVRKVLEEIGKKSKPEDIVMIFFAGHGVMQGATDKKFTLLTAEASKDNLVGINTNDLKSWLSPEGPNKMLANKSILIFDACNSGQAIQDFVNGSRSGRDDESERIRQVEDLKDKSGMFILAASAPNQSAYELPQYQQGLLTYCLLSTLKNDPNILDDNKYLNVQKWFLQTESLLKNTMESLGLAQNAQPYGTANIRIGLVDDGVKNNIQLAKEKPAVICINAEDKNTDVDGLRLKDKLNAKLMEITSRGIDAPIIYIEKETSSANAIKLKYEVKSGKVNCDVIFLKNQKKYNQSSVEGKEVDLEGLIDLIIGVVEKSIK
jgi:uncharacterized caspase-like protein/WD40 repeat protein